MNLQNEKLKVYVEGKVIISVNNEKQADIIASAVDPENKIMKNFEITTYPKNNKIITEFRNKITLRSLKTTLDDLLETIILAKDVSETINK